ncbi:hypothetical protein OS493_006901 [Desmophyllum pertusum]|uniref:Uncharacterized protein n=1 Tax=Desmophyllum pertusum TaxID=174260 RepID=A0A9W9ZSF6_9CNID|nr:hypothetical protein OS493_006901 [Desmophyllum pertusum]
MDPDMELHPDSDEQEIDHKVHEYDMAEIAVHAAFWGERDGKVLDTDKRHGGRAPSEKKHLIEGVRICIKAWCIVYGIAKTWCQQEIHRQPPGSHNYPFWMGRCVRYKIVS